ncbi:MAG: tetratricopeptide repeat protein [Acidobacteriota bacterium]
MMSRKRNSYFFACPAIMSCIAVAFLTMASLNSQETGSKATPRRSDVILLEGKVLLADGAPLRSTADDEQQKLIRGLIQAVAELRDAAVVTIDYPMDVSIFPPEIIAPTFLWHDASPKVDRWLVDIAISTGKETGESHIYVLVLAMAPPKGEIDQSCIAVTNEIYKPTPYQASARAWKPGEDLWNTIKHNSVEKPATITFYGYQSSDARILSRGKMVLSTSRDPVGAPIFYRDVPLMPSKGKDGVIKPLDQTALPLIAWRLKDISRPDSRVLLKDMPTCANCHSFSDHGKTLAMDLDGPDGDKGAYAIVDIGPQTVIRDRNVITWNAFEGKPKDRLTLGFLARISPDGRYVISTVNDSLYVRNFTDYRFLQVFYPTRGILAYYSRATGEIKSLPGADDPNYVHCNPVWTPDGKTIIFLRAKARNSYDTSSPVAIYAGDPNETPILFDMYRIPFNEGQGGHPEPIRGAWNNGMSNSFPKVSPDGKWIVFVKSKNGLLMRPDGKLWIVPVAGGEARLMRCNLPTMNSWHSFSPNGRWLVFSSKSNTPYTQMFLTHIDESGNDSPPILIENSTAANRAVNIPEFVNISYNSFLSILVPAVDHYQYFQRGNKLAMESRHREAVAEFEKALKGESKDWRINDWRIHDSLSKVLLQLGETDRAEEHIRESLKLNPDNAEMHGNLGFIMFARGNLEQARKNLDVALKLSPKTPKLWYDRATIRMSAGDYGGGIEDYSQAIQLDGAYTDAYNGRGVALLAQGDAAGALADFNKAIMLDPKNPTPWYFRAKIHKDREEFSEALNDCVKAKEVCPPDSPHLKEIQDLHREILELLRNKKQASR